MRVRPFPYFPGRKTGKDVPNKAKKIDNNMGVGDWKREGRIKTGDTPLEASPKTVRYQALFPPTVNVLATPMVFVEYSYTFLPVKNQVKINPKGMDPFNMNR